ncbi:hypothetical protein BDZ89DRAFT_104031 [Hymenopellis radicata]|nr:hypothetical protein BDZ89DRAFT_104031 [Hymenopellis radicata]
MSSSFPTDPRQPLSTSFDQQSAGNNRNPSSGSPGLSTFSRLGILAAFVTPFTVLPYLLTRRHISSVRRGLHDVRTKYGILQKELRLHEDRSVTQYNWLRDNCNKLIEANSRLEAQLEGGPSRQWAPPPASEQELSQFDALRKELALHDTRLRGVQEYAEAAYSEFCDTKNDKGVAPRARDDADGRLEEIEKNQSARDIAYQQTERAVTNIHDQIAELRSSVADNVKSAADRDAATHAQFMSLRAAMKSKLAEVNSRLDELTKEDISRLESNKDELQLDMDELSTRVASVEDQDERHSRAYGELNDKVEGLRQVYIETNELAVELKSFIENFKARMVDATEVPDLKLTVSRLSQSVEERLSALEAKSSTEEMQALASELRKQQEALKEARETQIVIFEVLRSSLIDMAGFVERTEPVIGMKYDNGQASRLRRLEIYLSSYQDQLQDSEKEKN